MKTHFVPAQPLAAPTFPLEDNLDSSQTEALALPLSTSENVQAISAVPGSAPFDGPALDETAGGAELQVGATEGEAAEDGVAVAPEQRAALSEDLSARTTPDGGGLTMGPVYGDCLDWMTRNGLAYDKTVYLRGYPQINSVWPCTLGVAMSHAAYLAGEGRAFEIHLPEVQESLLVGGDETGRLYGVSQVASELTRLYEVQRGLFLTYQAKYPLRMTLGEQSMTGNVAEVFIVQLSQMLEGAHERTRRAEGSLAVMDLISTSVAVALKRIFGGLVPLNRLGELLQDTERMEWLESNANDVLGLTPRN